MECFLNIGAHTATPHTYESVMEMLKVERPGKVLDVGAGAGEMTKLLLSAGFSVTACEIEPEKFKVKDVKCDRVDISKELPYGNSSFDHVVMVEVIEHLENQWRAIREIGFVLKKGGVLVLTTPNLNHFATRMSLLLTGNIPGFYYGDYKENRHISPVYLWNIERMLKEANFEIEKVDYNMGYIPKIRLRIPWKNKLTGQTIIVKARKR